MIRNGNYYHEERGNSGHSFGSFARYTCDSCGKCYRTWGSLKFHRNMECRKEPSFSCTFCGYKSHRKSNLLRHMRILNECVIDATVDETVDMPVQAWKVHERMVFAELKIPKASNFIGKSHGQFSCDRCSRSYGRKDSLSRHMQWECGKEPSFYCSFCSQGFKRKAHLQRHERRRHSDKLNSTEKLLYSYKPKMEID
ncbi:gastrula zinc finger protein XlCGF17.1-like [Pseudomyrmex gracilis]|uniref:gastrula zinc finger protein XlCGF17.1-like n=1 Tax=Pseudomyrmex gracilis TaxID=219809 RepID=UPI00099590E1|nr:gastrula zinc finger protein XlCGF17.1-like [Pseudomyrmex gracilis]